MSAMARDGQTPKDHADIEDIGDLDRAADARRRADIALSMSERLARVHTLCKQMGAVKGAARTAR
jgi:hypothetical protein